MEDPKRCPKCGHNAVRVRRVNPKGRELGPGLSGSSSESVCSYSLAHSSVHMAILETI